MKANHSNIHKAPYRMGQGFDVHALVEDRDLVLGGVTIPYHLGLAGHSDADALLHAMTDALIGAVALGDIGQHFPDTDPRFKGANSMVLLQHAYELVRGQGYVLGNIDSTIIAQQPKMSPHILGMRETIAKGLGLELNQINIKAKTCEKLGFLGRGEGIACEAVVMLVLESESKSEFGSEQTP